MEQQKQTVCTSDNLHDKVVEEIRNVLNQKDFDIYINPGQEKNVCIGGNYPDVIMTEKGKNTVKFILEIETSDTVTREEAERQWKKYANEINATFYIVVPSSAVQKAKDLCQQVEVNARFILYNIDNTGNLSFIFK